MESLITDLIRIQLSLAEGWITVINHGWRCWQNLAVANLELLQHPAFHRWHDVVPRGPSWTDHYGRRSHDIDVEHIR